MSRDFATIRYICDLLTPGLIYVEAAAGFEGALRAIAGCGGEVVTAEAFESLRAHGTLALLEPVEPDATAKILFTSGSTGLPKAVINTHRMLAANQQMIFQCWPFLGLHSPVLLDWLPWNHTFGGNHNFNLVLRHGGTMYIDGGRPTAALIEETVRNLREVSPDLYLNVPAGFAVLLPHLERDDDLARAFFRNLRLIFYAGAALPQDLWERMKQLAKVHRGAAVPMTSSWGTTETAPMAATAHFPLDRAGVIGLPPPGVELKLAPSGTKMEIRVRGANVTPGYYKRPDLTRDAFDDEGFYRSGDGGALADPERPDQGIVFDGRTAEDFKLQNGSWVHVGSLRVEILTACSPALQDLVVCGHDCAEVGILAWPASGVADPLAMVRHGLTVYNAQNPAATRRIARVLLMTEPPSIDANEITDKGYVNQRAVIERRRDLVVRLLADRPGDDVLVMNT